MRVWKCLDPTTFQKLRKRYRTKQFAFYILFPQTQNNSDSILSPKVIGDSEIFSSRKKCYGTKQRMRQINSCCCHCCCYFWVVFLWPQDNYANVWKIFLWLLIRGYLSWYLKCPVEQFWYGQLNGWETICLHIGKAINTPILLQLLHADIVLLKTSTFDKIKEGLLEG